MPTTKPVVPAASDPPAADDRPAPLVPAVDDQLAAVEAENYRRAHAGDHTIREPEGE